MTNYEIIEALGQITKEKNIDREFLIEILENSLLMAAKKKYGQEQNIEIKIDDISGEIEIYIHKTVVDRVEFPDIEIQVKKALKLDTQAAVGGTVKVLLPFEEFGRNAIQNIRQMVIQRIREAEREKIQKEYTQRIGEIVTGVVQQIDKGSVIINIGGRVEAIMPPKEQIRKEHFYQGDTIRTVVVEISQATKGPQVLVSRTHDEFLRRLFELEVPEIYEGMVQIKSVAREPGQRAKIAVYSIDPRIDPIGACVGYKGSRVQAIVRELSGERIDIVPWHSDPKKFVANSLSPAKISNIIIYAEKRKMTVIVDDDQLSLAIGKNGQNARLAARLTNWKLDLLNKSQYEELLKEARATEISLREVEAMDSEWIEMLVEAGYETVQDLEHVLVEDLLEHVEGLDEETANRMLDAIDDFLDSLDEQAAEEPDQIDESDEDDEDDDWEDEEFEEDDDEEDEDDLEAYEDEDDEYYDDEDEIEEYDDEEDDEIEDDVSDEDDEDDK